MIRLLLFLLLLCCSWSTFAQLTINVNSVPTNTPAADMIYLAGSMNGWNEADPNFVLTNNGNQTYAITINPSPGLLEFKFTRGSWATVEGNAGGGFQPNHEYNYSGNPSQVSIDILSWEDLGTSGSGPSTATENVLLLDQDFYMPQLDRNRRIWIYLPPDYQNTNNSYPVLYLQDGQNIFDAYTSFSGEWEVDESLNDLFNLGDGGAIVVAIDNGGAERINEYSPWVNPSYGGGQGALYVDFIINTLKPFIDSNYRTRPERETTGIVGSSMGGIIAMYAAIEHQEIFGKAGVFSPAFWFSDQVYSHVTNTGKEADMRIYLLAGGMEGNGSVVADVEAMYATLIDAGFDVAEVNVHTHADGQHSEWFWAREFPDAYLWLCADQTTSTQQANQNWKVSVFPNPAGELLYIHFQEEVNPEMSYQLYTTSGYKLLDRRINNRNIHIATNYLGSGVYWLNLLYKGKVMQTEKIIINK